MTSEKNSFHAYHPIVNLVYFVAVIGFSMTQMHPLLLSSSLLCAFLCALTTCRKKSVLTALYLCIPMALMAAILNPLFNHEGKTLLAHLPWGAPVTLESVLYGLFSAFMICAVILWFVTFNAVMTSDKIIYLFGKILPSFSLLISMTLRFIPRFKQKINEISLAEKSLNGESVGFLPRLKTATKILSVAVTWSLEGALDTADAMKCRAYGTKKRSTFSICKFRRSDAYTLLFIVACSVYTLAGIISGEAELSYFPTISIQSVTPYSASVLAVYTLLCLTPVILKLYEDLKWKSLYSKI